LTAFEVYRIYCALKAHFSGRFNVVEHGLGIKCKRSAFDKRNDKLFFERLANKHIDYIVPFFVANFVDNPDKYIFELQLNAETEEIYFNWKKRVTTLHKNAKEELAEIKSFMVENDLTFNDLFAIIDGKYPIIYRMVQQKYLSIETYILLDKAVGFHDYFCEILPDIDVTFDNFNRRVIGYKPFLLLDKARCKQIVKDTFIGDQT